jgi:hypothetical protein
MCFWYARLLEQDGRFFLSARMLGKALRVSYVIAAAHLKRAVAEGVLEMIEKGRPGKATRYRFRYEAIEYAQERTKRKGRTEDQRTEAWLARLAQASAR